MEYTVRVTFAMLTHWLLDDVAMSIVCELIIQNSSFTLTVKLLSGEDPTNKNATLVQVMVWCHQVTNHYLSQCWPRSLSPYGVTRPQWVKGTLVWRSDESDLWCNIYVTRIVTRKILIMTSVVMHRCDCKYDTGSDFVIFWAYTYIASPFSIFVGECVPLATLLKSMWTGFDCVFMKGRNNGGVVAHSGYCGVFFNYLGETVSGARTSN